jgi:hypothetical protein
MTFAHESESEFPRTQESYEDGEYDDIFEIIKHRIKEEPFNLVGTLVFFMAIFHTMCTSTLKKWAHQAEEAYEKLIEEKKVDKHSKSVKAGLLHLFGEVEVVFGIWTVVLGVTIALFYDWSTFTHYINGLHYTEPLFVVVIMSIAASRPILRFFEKIMHKVVVLLGETLDAWWLIILITGPLLGSLITEPAAMTICAYLLSEKVFSIGPSKKVQYATVALLFVNISIGGSLTNFAAPPILLVAEPWEWSISFMFMTFGWKSVVAILLSTIAYYTFLRQDFKHMSDEYEHYKYRKYVQKKFISQKELEENFDDLTKLVSFNTHFFSELDAYSMILKERIKDIAKEKLSDSEVEELDIENAIDEKYDFIKLREYQRTVPGLLDEDDQPEYHDPNWDHREDDVPRYIIIVHLGFLVWTIVNAHNPVLFLGGFLFFLGFFGVTSFYQNRLDLKPALLVAFFLSGLIIHGTLQAWWISPVLANLPPLGLNLSAIGLTAFNDNAALTYLATLVPDFSEGLKYAVVSGAIAGGGLTIIANAPNPVGASILKKHFKEGISPLLLLLYALVPTIITTIIFNLFKG